MTQERDDLSTLVHGLKTVTSPFRAFLNDLHKETCLIQDGEVANTLPELARVDPERFGICVADTSGKIYEAGDSNYSFLIQAIARPFLYGLVLQEYGREEVLKKIGVELTNNSFDELLSKNSAYHHNPMHAAGSIINLAMIAGENQTSRLNYMLNTFQKYAGREMHVDTPAFVSARLKGYRYRALVQLLLEQHILTDHVDDTLDLFFQQQSILVTCRDMAVMAATLANKGVNPVTGEQAIDETYIRDILSIMYTSGMQGYTGKWVYQVGIPSIGGIGGGILAVVPQRIGIAVFSPRLNENGHSVRGIKVCEELSQRFGLHLFDSRFGGSELQDAMNEQRQQRSRGADAKDRISRALI